VILKRADFDRFSAWPDRLPPYDRKSPHDHDTAHYKRDSLREHDGVGDAVRAGAGEQSESAALLAIEARFRHSSVLAGRCVGVLLDYLRIGDKDSRLRPRPSGLDNGIRGGAAWDGGSSSHGTFSVFVRFNRDP
jgi:hypothetical protein